MPRKSGPGEMSQLQVYTPPGTKGEDGVPCADNARVAENLPGPYATGGDGSVMQKDSEAVSSDKNDFQRGK